MTISPWAVHSKLRSRATTYIDPSMRVSQAAYIHILTKKFKVDVYRHLIDAAFAIEGV